MICILTNLNCICKHSVYRLLDIFNKNLNKIQCHRNIKALNNVSYVINSRDKEFKSEIKTSFLSVSSFTELFIWFNFYVCACVQLRLFFQQVLLLIIILISIPCVRVYTRYFVFLLAQSNLIWSGHIHTALSNSQGDNPTRKFRKHWKSI